MRVTAPNPGVGRVVIALSKAHNPKNALGTGAMDKSAK